MKEKREAILQRKAWEGDSGWIVELISKNENELDILRAEGRAFQAEGITNMIA